MQFRDSVLFIFMIHVLLCCRKGFQDDGSTKHRQIPTLPSIHPFFQQIQTQGQIMINSWSLSDYYMYVHYTVFFALLQFSRFFIETIAMLYNYHRETERIKRWLQSPQKATKIIKKIPCVYHLTDIGRERGRGGGGGERVFMHRSPPFFTLKFAVYL